MKSSIRNLYALSFLGLSLNAQAAPYLVPNGDFSTASGENWNDAASPGTVITYEATGGNSGGYGKIDNTAGAWGGVLVAEGGTGANPATGDGIPLTALGTAGLTAGETYTFSVDIIDLGTGTTKAGMKMESWGPSGFIDNGVGDIFFPITNSWATYTLDYTVNAAATHIKFVPLLTGDQPGPVGFDNIGGDDVGEEPPPFEPIEVDNGDFEIPNGANWVTEGTASFPATGGNPGGHVLLSRTPDFAVAYAFDGGEPTFASLGLAVGDSYTVNFDMKVISGTGGGVRLTGPAGYTPEVIIGGTSEWATYSVQLTVPSTPQQTRFGVFPAPGAVVAFDNVSIGVPGGGETFCANISQGTVVSWMPTDPANNYQPQESADNSVWTDLGPLVMGDSVSSVNDDDGAAFYRVQEYTFSAAELIDDGGFEVGSEWELNVGDVDAEEVESAADAFAGNWFVRLAVDNGAAAVPQKSRIQQMSPIGSVSPGDVMDFSVQIYVESFNDAVFNYFVMWIGADDGVISQTDGQANGLNTGVWTEITVPGLVAPAGTVRVLVAFEAVTGSVVGHAGSYRLDEISLSGSTSSFLQNIAATPTTGMLISWESQAGYSYQVKSSSDLVTFSDLGGAITGDGNTMTVGQALTSKEFFQVIETAP